MPLKKPSQLFKSEVKEEELSSPVKKYLNETYQQFQGTLSNIENLQERIDEIYTEYPKTFQLLAEEVSNRVTKSDLDNVMYSQLEVVDRNYKEIQEKIKGVNRKDLREFKNNVSQLTEIVNNLIESELPKYKNRVTKSEVKLSEKFETTENKVTEELNKFSSFLEEKIGEFDSDLVQTKEDVLNTNETFNKLRTIVRDEQLETKQKLEKFSDTLSEFNDQANNFRESLSDTLENDVEDLKKELKTYIDSDFIVLEKHIKDDNQKLEQKIDAYFEENNQELVKLKENVIDDVTGIFKGDIVKNVKKLERKIKSIQEKYESIKPEEIIQEGLLNIQSNEKNSDPLTPLDKNFVTTKQLQDHYRIFLNRVQEQLSTLGGGGETRLEFLDDVDRDTALINGKVLQYNSATKKWKGVSASGIGTEDSLVTSGIITAGNVTIGGITTALVVNGDAAITGILTVGENTLTLDGDNNIVQVGTALTLGHTQGIQFHTQNLHASGFEVNQINASGITTVNQLNVSGDGYTSVIKTGSPYLTIEDGSNTSAVFNPTGSTELRFNNQTKIQTTNTGASITGKIEATDAEFSGNVSVGGTLTYEDVTNVDSVGLITARNGINVSGGTLTVNNNSDLNGDLDVDGHTNLDNVSVAGVTTFHDDVTFHGQTSGRNATWDYSQDSLVFADNAKAAFGNGSKATIRHSGSQLFVNNNNGNIYLRVGDENGVLIKPNSSVRLYHDGNLKFETTGVGATIFGNTETQTLNVTGVSTFAGNVDINGDLDVSGIATLGKGASGEVELYHQNVRRYNTTTWGQQTHGILQNFGDIETVKFDSTSSRNLIFKNDSGGLRKVLEIGHASSNSFITGHIGNISINAPQVSISTNFSVGGISTFTGNIIANSSLGIGTNDPSQKVDIFNGTDDPNIIIITGQDRITEYAGVGVFQGNATFTGGGIGGTNAGISLRTADGGTEIERVRITSDGKVGINSTSPTHQLEVLGDSSLKGNVSVGGATTISDVLNVSERVTCKNLLASFDGNTSISLLDTGHGFSASEIGISNGGRDLDIKAPRDIRLKPSDGLNGIVIENNGPVELYHANALRLTTSSAGISIPQDLDVDGHTELDNVNITGLTTFSDNIFIPDNKKIRFGDPSSPDLEIYHSGTASFISDIGGGVLKLTTDGLRVRNASDNQNMIKADQNLGVELFYNNIKRFTTSGIGVTIIGEADVNGDLNVSGVSTFSGITTVTGTTLFAKDVSVSGVITATSFDGNLPIANDANNRLITASGSGGLNAEGGLTYDGDQFFNFTGTGYKQFTVSSTSNNSIQLKLQNSVKNFSITNVAGGSFSIADGSDTRFTINSSGVVGIASGLNVSGIATLGSGASGGFELYHQGVNRISSRNYGAFVNGSLVSTYDLKVGSYNGRLIAGTNNEFSIKHDNTNTIIDNTVGIIDIKSQQVAISTHLSVGGVSTFTGDATFSGNVSIGGTLTYEDVTNIDSVGLVTAREGIFIPDTKKLQIGNAAGSADLKIFHEGNHNRIQATSNLIIGDENYDLIKVYPASGGVHLLYTGGQRKLETTSTGISVTGQGVFSSAITASTYIQGTSSNGGLKFYSDSSASKGVVLNTDDHLVPSHDSNSDLGLTGTRWRNVYADTLYGDGSNLSGISAGFFEQTTVGIHTLSKVGIGTTNPQAQLEINVGSAVTAFDIQGSQGQLFSVTNNLSTGSIFSVNDISGMPSIDVDADGTIQLAPLLANDKVGIGTTNPQAKLDVNGSLNVTGITTVQDLEVTGNNIYLSHGGSYSGVTTIGTYYYDRLVINSAIESDNQALMANNQIDIGWPGSEFGDAYFTKKVRAAEFGEFNLISAGIGSTHVNLTVTVATKNTDHRYHGQGSNSGYVVDNIQSPFFTFTPGRKYRFNQSDGSNSSHQIKFYLEADRTTLYETGVTYNGTAGNAGAYTQIEITDSTPNVLHYQCVNHPYMGNAFQTNSNSASKKFDSNITLSDDVKAIFGSTGVGDLQIFHGSSGNYINRNVIRTTNTNTLLFEVANGSNGIAFNHRFGNGTNDFENMITATPNAGVSLYFDGNKRIETTDLGNVITGLTTITPEVKFTDNPGSSNLYHLVFVDPSTNTQYAANVGVAKTLYHRYGGITFDDYSNTLSASGIEFFKASNLIAPGNNNNRMHLRQGPGGSNSGGDASLGNTDNESIALFECSTSAYITIASGVHTNSNAGVLFATSNGNARGSILYNDQFQTLSFRTLNRSSSNERLSLSESGAVVSGVVTATSFKGPSGVTATFIGDGSGLTGVTASGSGIDVKDSGSVVGTAGTIDFGANLSVSAVSAGIVTITGAASGGGLTVQDEGSALSTTATTLNFVGDGVVASGTGATKTITISGGGGSSAGGGLFSIEGERNGGVATNQYYAVGNGAQPTQGQRIPVATSLKYMTLSNDGNATMTVELYVNGSGSGKTISVSSSSSATADFTSSPLSIAAGDRVTFRCTSGSSGSTSVVAGWFHQDAVLPDSLVGTALSVSGISTLGNVLVGGGTTDLVVNGDARVTGILTVGTGSITIDPNEDKIQVGKVVLPTGNATTDTDAIAFAIALG